MPLRNRNPLQGVSFHRCTYAVAGALPAILLVVGASPVLAAEGTAAPAAVSGMVTSADKSRVKLDWKDNTEFDLAGYLVYRASSPDGEFVTLTPTPKRSSSYSDSTAPIGVPSYYQVTAIGKSGNESAPVAASATRKDGVAPAAPTLLRGSRTENGITLDWADSPEQDLAGYLVVRATSSGGTYARLTPSPVRSTTFTDTGAAAGVNYYYRVNAVDFGGLVSKPAGTAVLVPDVTPPSPVGSLVATANTSRVKLDWPSNTEKDLAGYRVHRAPSADGPFVQLTTSPRKGSDYSDPTAPAGLRSFYRVTAVDKSGNESSPVAVDALRPDKIAPSAPSSLAAAGSDDAVVLTWDANAEADLVGYHVSRATSPTGTYARLTATALTSPGYTDSTAPVGVTMYYRVTAVDLSGNTSVASAASAARTDTTAPGTVADVAAVAGESRVALSWAAVQDADLAGYHVYRQSADGGFAKITTAPVTTASFLDTGVVNGTSYAYEVTAVDGAGNESPRSATVSATPSDTTPPAAPGSLTGTGTDVRVDLDWADNTEPDLAGYTVERADSADGPFVPLAGGVTSSQFADTSPAAGPTSWYRVITADLAGNVSPGTVVEVVRADTTAPAMPAGLASSGAVANVTLTWDANTEADLAGYVVSRAPAPNGEYVVLPTMAGQTAAGQTVTATTYVDTTAPVGASSYYRVTAVDTAGNASPAATTQATALPEKTPVAGADVTVAQDGTGDFTTIAAALAAAPADTGTPFVIGIKPGTYRELLAIKRPNVTLLGGTANASDVVITYGNAACTPKPDGSGTYGTSGSATVLIAANNVTTKNLTIENSYVEIGSGSEQAVALKTSGDRLVFDNVRLLGDQDTLYADSPGPGVLARSYYVNSSIEGDVDFVFGRGTAVFDRSTLTAATRGSTSNNGYVTAASTDKSLPFGFLITDSTIVSDAPAGSFHLGRPWQPSNDQNAIAQVVIRDTELPAAIKAAPWADMTTTFSWRNARLFEYHNSGPGAAVNGDRPQLTVVEAARHTKWTYLAGSDGWNPTGVPAPADVEAPAAASGLAATAGDATIALTWTAGTAADLAGYNVYRAEGPSVEVSAASLLTSSPVTGAQFTDRTARNGVTYSYGVTAVDSAGNESALSARVAAAAVGTVLPAHDLLVATDGTGQYTTVQSALDAAPAGTAAKPTVIAVKPGVYPELIQVTKNYVTLIGTTGNARDVVLTYANAAGTTNPATGTAYGTGASQSVLVKGSNVTVRNLTIENSFDEAAATFSGKQAVALKTTGDRLVFDNVRVLGNQDTLLVDSPDAPIIARAYFVNSYVEGDVDFVFGRGTAVFHKSTLHALSRGSSSNNGYITAASTSDRNPYGILITDSTITSDAPAGTFSLGRPWRGWSDGYTKNGVVYNSRGQVTIRDTQLPAAIRTTQPWADMSPNLWTDGRFFEYRNTGDGATVNDKRPQLTDAVAADHTAEKYLAGTDGWNPVIR